MKLRKMSRQSINIYIGAFLLVCGLITINAAADSSEELNNSADTPQDLARAQLLDAITEDYLTLLDFELSKSQDIVQSVLDDDKLLVPHSEIFQKKKMQLKIYIDLVTEKQQKKLPPRTQKPARFFYIFSKSLLYKDFIGMIARLEPTDRYDALIDDTFMDNGLGEFVDAVMEKRNALVAKSVRLIHEYLKGLPAEQQRKAMAYKLSDWALKMKQAEEVTEKMANFREFLRYFYLEATITADKAEL
ncbi:uncharacterized protein LOC101456541 [Ceratitis capitata]|uniref:uncharacterized protein LOC101456541 n=1 Tax=Ceratitis capitata TaxID=7213 RepID=UPI00032A2A33|nr:uncharacterized protein LOC101456541 [Ceratitis capitata]